MSDLKHPDPNDGHDKSPYFICDVCATLRGGVYYKTCSTASALTCGYCDGKLQIEEFIYPSVDYLWPSQVAKHPDGGKRSADRIAKQRADYKTQLYDQDEFPTDDFIKRFRAENDVWKAEYKEEFERIQKLWGFE